MLHWGTLLIPRTAFIPTVNVPSYSGGPAESPIESRRWPCRAPVKLLGTARACKSAGLALLREDPLEHRFGHRYNPQECRFQNTHTHTHTHTYPCRLPISRGTNVPLQTLQLYVEAHHAMCGPEHTHTHVPLQVTHQ